MPSAGLPAGGILCYTKNMKISRLLQEEELKPQIVISVRNLVEFLMNAGDIDDRHGGQMRMEAMQEGSRIHRKIQRRAGADYHAEIPLKFIVSYEEYDLAIEGRADGIIYEEGLLEETSRFLEDPRMDLEEGQEEAKPFVMIDEIKGVYLDVEQMAEPNAVHLAQAKCYAFIFATQHALPAIGVQMTYCNLDTEEIRRQVLLSGYDLKQVEKQLNWEELSVHRDFSIHSIQSILQLLSYQWGKDMEAKELLNQYFLNTIHLRVRKQLLCAIVPSCYTGKHIFDLYFFKKTMEYGDENVQAVLFIAIDFQTSAASLRFLENGIRYLQSNFEELAPHLTEKSVMEIMTEGIRCKI